MGRRLAPVALSTGPAVPAIDLVEGQSTCVLGQYGTGKSEYCLYALGYPMAATVAQMRPNADPKRVAFIPTNPRHLFSGIKSSLKGELELSCQFLGRPVDDIADIVSLLGLAGLVDHDPFTLSGGEAVRAAIAIAAAKRPSVWILDQTYDALAPSARDEVRNLFEHYAAQGAAIIETHSRPPNWVHKFDLVLALDRRRGVICGNYGERIESAASLDLLTSDSQLKRIERNGVSADDYLSLATTASTTSRVFEVPDINHVGRLEANGVTFRHGKSGFAVGPLGLTCDAGECLALIGPNGAGKTTTLRLLAGLHQPNDGRVQFAGRRPKSALEWARNVLYCFQDPDDQLYLPTVVDELFITSKNLKRRARDAEWIIATLDLADHLEKSSMQLPLSQRRLITIASALIASPPLVALDEPTAALDTEQTFRLLIVLLKYLGEGGAILLVSHDYDFVGEIASRLAIMEDGKIIQEASPNSWPTSHPPFALRHSRGTAYPTASLRTLLTMSKARVQTG